MGNGWALTANAILVCGGVFVGMGVVLIVRFRLRKQLRISRRRNVTDWDALELRIFYLLTAGLLMVGIGVFARMSISCLRIGDPPSSPPSDTILILTSIEGEPAPPPERRAFPRPLAWVAAGLLILGASAFVHKSSTFGAKVAGTALIAASGTGLAINEVHLLPRDVSLHRYIVKPKLTILREGSTLKFEEIGRVGPFMEGEDSLLLAPAREGFERVLQAVRSYAADGRVGVILVGGGVDRRQLRERARAKYGSNEGLAAARAKWMAKQLESSLQNGSADSSNVTVPFVPWGMGPSRFDPTLSTEDLEADRHVVVLIGIKGTPPATGEQHP